MKQLASLFAIHFCLFFAIHVASAQSQEQLNIRMLEAVKNNQPDSVKFLIEKGANVNYIDTTNCCSLNYAANNNFINLCKILIEKGANVDGPGKSVPPIFSAAIAGNLRICHLLFLNGANQNTSDYLKKSIIDNVKEFGYLRIAEYLEYPEKYSENPTCFEYYRYSEDAVKTNDSITALRYADLAIRTAEIEILQTTNQFGNFANNVAFIYFKLENFAKAEPLLLKALKLNEHFNGKESESYTSLLSVVAFNYLNQKKYDDSESCFKELLSINEKVKGEDNPDYISTLNSLAYLYLIQEKIDQAESLLPKIRKILLSIEETQNSIYTNSLNNIAGTLNRFAALYEKTYQWSKAEELYLKSLQIIKKQEVKDVQNFSALLNNLAGFYSNTGQYNKVEPLYQNALESLKKTYGEFHPSYLNCLHNLSMFYKEIKLYDKAFATCGLALGLTKMARGKENIDYLRYNNSMAALSMNLYCFDLADSILNSSMQICEKTGLYTHDPLYLNTIELQATLYSDQKKYNLAEPLLMRLLDASRNDLGERSLQSADLLQKLGTLYSNQGKFKLAESFYKKAIEIKKEVVGENHPDFIELLNDFGMACHENGDYSQATKYYLDASTKKTNQIKFSLSYLSSWEREKFWEENKSIFNVYDIFVKDSYSRNPGISSFAFNNELFIKGLLLNSSLEIKNTLLNSNDSIIINELETLKAIRNQIIISANKKEELLKLYVKADSIDKILTQRSQAYRQAQSEQQIKWQDVQSKLKEGEAAIEFSSFRYFHKEWTDSTLYCALVLKKGMGYPVMVPLCEQKQLDSLFVRGNAIPNTLYASRGVTAEYKDQLPNGQRLYKLIWQPLEKELQDVKTVYYSPSGSLHQISFAALPTDTVHYLCDRYNLVQLSSTRQLATAAWQAKPRQISSTALFGGIKYDLADQELAELQRSLPPKEINNFRGFIPDSTRSSTSFGFLKGTLDEVESISTTLQTSHIKTKLYTGLQGSEEYFKALNNQNTSVLHIATHGFFYPDIQQKPERFEDLMSLGEQKFRYAPNPLLRSGLILAGGNRAWKGEAPVAGREDGILTAQEISEMNLQNTELVVLSACETGLGDIKGGEGVFGLQRAFKLAGVKTIIMSLWKVDDKATSEMMQLFYSKWLSGTDKHEAFRLAQQELKKKYKEPYYWAGFVMLD